MRYVVKTDLDIVLEIGCRVATTEQVAAARSELQRLREGRGMTALANDIESIAARLYTAAIELRSLSRQLRHFRL